MRNTSTCTIYELYNFLLLYPQYNNKIKVNTRHGFNTIKTCAITAYNSEVYEVILDNGLSIKTSPDHLLFNQEWIKVKNLKIGDKLLTDKGLSDIISIIKLDYLDDLYDLEVDTVHEFYANNIVSHNSNIIDSFNFAIFGDSLRDLNKAQTINNLTNGLTRVILEFNCNSPKGNNDFIITRELNPSSCKITKDGKDKSRDSINNTTKYILEVLSGSQEVFRNCIIMRANNTISFMAQGKVDKKKFIESIFNLDIITKMFRLVKDDINLQKRDLDVESKLITQINTNIDSYNTKLSNQLVLIEEASKNDVKNKDLLNEKINKLINDNDKITTNLTTDNNFIELEKALKIEVDKINKAQINLSNKLALNKNEENIINTNLKQLKKLGASCPECKHLFSKDDINQKDIEELKLNDRLNLILSERVKLNDLNKKTNNLSKTKQNELDKLKDVRYEYQDSINLINRNKDLIKSYKDNLLSLSNNIKINNNSDLSVLEDLIKTTKIDKDKKDSIIKNINSELSKLEIARFVLSDEGIRAYVIKKLLDLLNFRIKYYLAKQNSQYTLIFNEVFDDEIKNKKGLIVSYYNLSGAESKMLDLACIWAFRDILKLQGSVSYNIAFYDEILDTSMDQQNSQIVCDILNEFGTKENQAIYLISHKVDFLKAVTGEVIQLEKKNGITKRKYTI